MVPTVLRLLGVGKTTIVKEYLKKQLNALNEEDIDLDDEFDENDRVKKAESVWPVKLSLSAEMGIRDIQLLLESNLNKKSSNVYGPHTGNHCVVFADDVHQARQARAFLSIMLFSQ